MKLLKGKRLKLALHAMEGGAEGDGESASLAVNDRRQSAVRVRTALVRLIIHREGNRHSWRSYSPGGWGVLELVVRRQSRGAA